MGYLTQLLSVRESRIVGHVGSTSHWRLTASLRSSNAPTQVLARVAESVLEPHLYIRGGRVWKSESAATALSIQTSKPILESVANAPAFGSSEIARSRELYEVEQLVYAY